MRARMRECRSTRACTPPAVAQRSKSDLGCTCPEKISTSFSLIISHCCISSFIPHREVASQASALESRVPPRTLGRGLSCVGDSEKFPYGRPPLSAGDTVPGPQCRLEPQTAPSPIYGVGKSTFTSVSTQNTVYPCVIKYCVIFHPSN